MSIENCSGSCSNNWGACDAVLMDLNLPRIGGIEATRRILLDHANRDDAPAIIAGTASVSDADRALCAAAGMRGFLTKPATVFSLDAALREAVGEAPLPEVVAAALSELPNEVTLESMAELDQRAAELCLSSDRGIRVVGEAEDGQRAVELVRKDGIDVRVLDLAMPGRAGLWLLRQLRDEAPELRIVVFSAYDPVSHQDRSIALGASAYFAKDTLPTEIV